jgi:LuxR family maltose regulon positive regulatory protein
VAVGSVDKSHEAVVLGALWLLRVQPGLQLIYDPRPLMVRVEGTLRNSLREGLAGIGLIPTRSKLYRPPSGSVSRLHLVNRVAAVHGELIVVCAPAGYGKSTFIAELTAADPRPSAWVSVTAAEDDPASFLTYVALALDELEPVDATCVSPLWTGSPTIGSVELQRFAAMVADRQRPFVLVLDDVHELAGRAARDALATLVGALPDGSTMVFGSRTPLPLRLGRMRTRRRLIEVGPADLAFGEGDAMVLFAELGLEVSPAQVAELVERTEGWPAALYLAALALGERPGSASAVMQDFAGDHAFLVDYLGEELLGAVDDELATFMMEASCLERVSGNFGDDVLERRDSARLLEELRRKNMLVIPLDDRREWYRFHHLLSQFLQSELMRRNPARHAEVHVRASQWCDTHGDANGAVRYAVLSGDIDRAETMVLRWYGTLATAGRGYSTSDRWMAMFPPDEVSGRPLVMAMAAWGRFAAGDLGAAVQWLARAEVALPERYPSDVYGVVAPVAVALARAIMAPLGPRDMAREAEYVYAHVGFDEGHPMACLARGAATFMLGDEIEAARLLREGAHTTLQRPTVVASCLAHLAVIDAEHGRWKDATVSARQARALIGDADVFASTSFVLAMSVLVETHAGRSDDAEADRIVCRQHLTGLMGGAPWLNLQTRVALAQAALMRGNRTEAVALVDEADAILATVPDAVHVAAQIAALRTVTALHERTPTFGPSSLTTAELRVLRLMPTHLSVADIAGRFYVSRNTVKSQMLAIYRKLGTSSRRDAVQIAAAAGLLYDVVGRE